MVVTTNSPTSEKNAYEGAVATGVGDAKEEKEIGATTKGRSVHRRPNDLLTNERSTEISSFLFSPLSLLSIPALPLRRSPFPRIAIFLYILYLTVISLIILFDDETNIERI